MLFIILIFFISSIILTILLKFPQFKIFKKIKNSKNKKTKQMFYLGLATNLGIGNLVGVSAAIYYGGPGVLFWMSLFAFFSSSFAYLEAKYAIKSRVLVDDTFRTGTCYTIINNFKGKMGISLACVFAVILLVTNSIFFPPIQVNAIVNIFNGNLKLIWSIILFLLIALITKKGIKMILKVSDTIIPITSVIYTILIVALIFYKYELIIPVLKSIVNGAFNIKSFGISSIISTIYIGISKSLFSNEAGLGTMPSLLGEAYINEIEEVSAFQMLSVIIDTVFLCTLTGIFILQNNIVLNDNINYIFTDSMYNVLGKSGLVISKIFVFLFGFSSIIGQYYLGESNALFFMNFKKVKLKQLFEILFYIGIGIGIFSTFEVVNTILDIGMLILGMINLAVIFTIFLKEKNNKNT